MGKEKREICECCGQVINTYKFTLTKSLSNLILKLANYGKEFNTKNLRDSNIITSSDYTNMTHLRYLGLVDKVMQENGDRGEGRLWFITQKGIDYICGNSVEKWVKIRKKKIIEISPIKQTISESIGYYKPPSYWQEMKTYSDENGQMLMFDNQIHKA